MSFPIEQVYWFLCGDMNIASSRLQGYQIHEWLKGLGLGSDIVFAPKNGFLDKYPPFQAPPFILNLRGAVVVIQKLKGAETQKLIRWLKRCGSRIVYINCDLDEEDRNWMDADSMLVTSEALLRNHLSRMPGCKIQVVQEPYEFSCDPRFKKPSRDSGQKIVAWFGHSNNWGAILDWKQIIENEFADYYRLITCSDHPQASIFWSLNNVRELLLTADIAILPTEETAAFAVKSPNRLVQCMAMGVPSVVGSLDSYERIIGVQGLPAFLARTEGEFRRCLHDLLDDDFRRAIALQAYERATSLYAPELVIGSWINALGVQNLSADRVRHWYRVKNILVWALGLGCFAGRQRERMIRLRKRLSKAAGW